MFFYFLFWQFLNKWSDLFIFKKFLILGEPIEIIFIKHFQARQKWLNFFNYFFYMQLLLFVLFNLWYFWYIFQYFSYGYQYILRLNGSWLQLEVLPSNLMDHIFSFFYHFFDVCKFLIIRFVLESSPYLSEILLIYNEYYSKDLTFIFYTLYDQFWLFNKYLISFLNTSNLLLFHIYDLNLLSCVNFFDFIRYIYFFFYSIIFFFLTNFNSVNFFLFLSENFSSFLNFFINLPSNILFYSQLIFFNILFIFKIIFFWLINVLFLIWNIFIWVILETIIQNFMGGYSYLVLICHDFWNQFISNFIVQTKNDIILLYYDYKYNSRPYIDYWVDIIIKAFLDLKDLLLFIVNISFIVIKPIFTLIYYLLSFLFTLFSFFFVILGQTIFTTIGKSLYIFFVTSLPALNSILLSIVLLPTSIFTNDYGICYDIIIFFYEGVLAFLSWFFSTCIFIFKLCKVLFHVILNIDFLNFFNYNIIPFYYDTWIDIKLNVISLLTNFYFYLKYLIILSFHSINIFFNDVIIDGFFNFFNSLSTWWQPMFRSFFWRFNSDMTPYSFYEYIEFVLLLPGLIFIFWWVYYWVYKKDELNLLYDFKFGTYGKPAWEFLQGPDDEEVEWEIMADDEVYEGDKLFGIITNVRNKRYLVEFSSKIFWRIHIWYVIFIFLLPIFVFFDGFQWNDAGFSEIGPNLYKLHRSSSYSEQTIHWAQYLIPEIFSEYSYLKEKEAYNYLMTHNLQLFDFDSRYDLIKYDRFLEPVYDFTSSNGGDYLDAYALSNYNYGNEIPYEYKKPLLINNNLSCNNLNSIMSFTNNGLYYNLAYPFFDYNSYIQNSNLFLNKSSHILFKPEPYVSWYNKSVGELSFVAEKFWTRNEVFHIKEGKWTLTWNKWHNFSAFSEEFQFTKELYREYHNSFWFCAASMFIAYPGSPAGHFYALGIDYVGIKSIKPLWDGFVNDYITHFMLRRREHKLQNNSSEVDANLTMSADHNLCITKSSPIETNIFRNSAELYNGSKDKFYAQSQYTLNTTNNLKWSLNQYLAPMHPRVKTDAFNLFSFPVTNPLSFVIPAEVNQWNQYKSKHPLMLTQGFNLKAENFNKYNLCNEQLGLSWSRKFNLQSLEILPNYEFAANRYKTLYHFQPSYKSSWYNIPMELDRFFLKIYDTSIRYDLSSYIDNIFQCQELYNKSQNISFLNGPVPYRNKSWFTLNVVNSFENPSKAQFYYPGNAWYHSNFWHNLWNRSIWCPSSNFYKDLDKFKSNGEKMRSRWSLSMDLNQHKNLIQSNKFSDNYWNFIRHKPLSYMDSRLAYNWIKHYEQRIKGPYTLIFKNYYFRSKNTPQGWAQAENNVSFFFFKRLHKLMDRNFRIRQALSLNELISQPKYKSKNVRLTFITSRFPIINDLKETYYSFGYRWSKIILNYYRNFDTFYSNFNLAKFPHLYGDFRPGLKALMWYNSNFFFNFFYKSKERLQPFFGGLLNNQYKTLVLNKYLKENTNILSLKKKLSYIPSDQFLQEFSLNPKYSSLTKKSLWRVIQNIWSLYMPTYPEQLICTKCCVYSGVHNAEVYTKSQLGYWKAYEGKHIHIIPSNYRLQTDVPLGGYLHDYIAQSTLRKTFNSHELFKVFSTNRSFYWDSRRTKNFQWKNTVSHLVDYNRRSNFYKKLERFEQWSNFKQRLVAESNTRKINLYIHDVQPGIVRNKYEIPLTAWGVIPKQKMHFSRGFFVERKQENKWLYSYSQGYSVPLVKIQNLNFKTVSDKNLNVLPHYYKNQKFVVLNMRHPIYHDYYPESCTWSDWLILQDNFKKWRPYIKKTYNLLHVFQSNFYKNSLVIPSVNGQGYVKGPNLSVTKKFGTFHDWNVILNRKFPGPYYIRDWHGPTSLGGFGRNIFLGRDYVNGQSNTFLAGYQMNQRLFNRTRAVNNDLPSLLNIQEKYRWGFGEWEVLWPNGFIGLRQPEDSPFFDYLRAINAWPKKIRLWNTHKKEILFINNNLRDSILSSLQEFQVRLHAIRPGGPVYKNNMPFFTHEYSWLKARIGNFHLADSYFLLYSSIKRILSDNKNNNLVKDQDLVDQVTQLSMSNPAFSRRRGGLVWDALVEKRSLALQKANLSVVKAPLSPYLMNEKTLSFSYLWAYQRNIWLKDWKQLSLIDGLSLSHMTHIVSRKPRYILFGRSLNHLTTTSWLYPKNAKCMKEGNAFQLNDIYSVTPQKFTNILELYQYIIKASDVNLRSNIYMKKLFDLDSSVKNIKTLTRPMVLGDTNSIPINCPKWDLLDDFLRSTGFLG